MARSWVLAVIVFAGALPAQATRRLPVIAGNGMVNSLVEMDGTVLAWGFNSKFVLVPTPAFKVKLIE